MSRLANDAITSPLHDAVQWGGGCAKEVKSGSRSRPLIGTPTPTQGVSIDKGATRLGATSDIHPPRLLPCEEMNHDTAQNEGNAIQTG